MNVFRLGSPRRIASRTFGLLAGALMLLAGVWLPSAAPVRGAGTSGASSVAVRVGGQLIVFGGAVRQGTIFLSQNGYAYVNPGFDFATGKETSGFNATPDLAITSGGQPYDLSGVLAVFPRNGVLSSPPVSRTIQPYVHEILIVLDAKGQYVLVGIASITPNAITFHYLLGTPQGAPPATLGNTVSLRGHVLTFPSVLYAGQIALSQNGEVAVQPGFDFEHDRQVSATAQPVGMAATGTAGGITLTAYLASVGSNGQAASWPRLANVPARTGAAYLVVDALGNYVLLQLDSVSANAVSFHYRLLFARDLSVLPNTPVTLQADGSSITFGGPTRFGMVQAARQGGVSVQPGYDLVRGREVAGLSANPDVVLGAASGFATLGGLLAGLSPSATSVRFPAQAGAQVAVPFERFMVVDRAGQYVLLGIASATPQVVTFAYKVQTAGPTYVLQPPNPATVPATPKFAPGGVLIYATFFRPAYGLPTEVDSYAILSSQIRPFAHAQAVSDPSLSPNGAWLATVSGSNLYVRAADGPQHLVASNANVLHDTPPPLSWSPDSRYLAYQGVVDENGSIVGDALWVVEPSTGRSRVVVDPVTSGLAVDDMHWLPHDQLIFSAGNAFYRVSPDWRQVVKVPVSPGIMGNRGRFSVSWNGLYLTWVAQDAHGVDQVMVATLDGRQKVQFTHSRWNNWSPQFSPDNSTVVYVAGTGPSPGGELWGFTLDGKAQGMLLGPDHKTPITHVVDLEEWYPGASVRPWIGS